MAAVYKSLKKASGRKEEAPANGVRKNKQRVLLLSSRGGTHQHRHFQNDLAALLPHARKDAKFDSKSRLWELNELAEMYNTNNILFMETRKHKDLYLWMSKPPNGPTVKFHVQNLHTMEELSFTGNSLKGSRPLLSFDSAFDNEPHLQLIRSMFTQIFGVPPGARRSKPFIDRVMGFSFCDGKIWIRNYEIKEVEATEAQPEDEDAAKSSSKKAASKVLGLKNTDVSLLEIGPRAVLTVILILEGSFGGPVIYENKQFVSPNQVRSELRNKAATRHAARAEQTVGRLTKKGDLGLRTEGGKKAKTDELDTKMLFA